MKSKYAYFLIVLFLVSCSYQPSFFSTQWGLACQNINDGWFVLSDVSKYNDIALTEDYIWVASSGGLLRFDSAGKELLQFLSPTCPIGSNYIASLSIYRGKLFISDDVGVAVFDYKNDLWVDYIKYEDYGLEFPLFQASKIINDQVWISAGGGILIYVEEENWQVLYPESEYDNVEIWNFYQDENDVLHVLARDADQNAFSFEATTHLIWDSYVWKRVSEPYEEIIYGPEEYVFKNDNLNGGVFISKDNGKTWVEFIRESPYTKLLYVGDDGEIYIGTLDGIIKYDANLEPVQLFQYDFIGPNLSSVEEIRCNRNNICAIIAMNGWSLFDSSLLLFRDEAQLKDVQITDDRIYYLFNRPINNTLHFRDLDQLNNANNRIVFSEAIQSYAVTEDYVLVITENSDGYLLIEGEKEPVFSFRDYQESQISDTEIIRSKTDPMKLLLINDLGIFKFDGHSLEKITIDSLVPLDYVSNTGSLAFIENELIIVNKEFEVKIINLMNGSIETTDLHLENDLQEYRSIAIDEHKSIFIAGEDNLFRYDWKGWACISEEELGLVGVFSIYIDPNGNIWSSSSSKISVNRTDLGFHSCED
jgi:ligand-binding sensor domain-containing protein